MTQKPIPKVSDPVAVARQAFLEGVGEEVADSFPGITRLGGQIVAALYLADGPRSMDALSLELGRAKSNIFANLRGLEAAGIVARRRDEGERYDTFALRGKYPDVIIGAYLGRLRRVVADKQALCERTLEALGAAKGDEAEALRARIRTLSRKYDTFAVLFRELLPESDGPESDGLDGPLDLEALIDGLPKPVLSALAAIVRKARKAIEIFAPRRDGERPGSRGRDSQPTR